MWDQKHFVAKNTLLHIIRKIRRQEEFNSFSYFLGPEKASTTDGGEFSSTTAINNTDSTSIGRGNGSGWLSYKGHQNQRCNLPLNSKRTSQFEQDTCCDPVLAANMAALAFNLNTSGYKLKRCDRISI